MSNAPGGSERCVATASIVVMPGVSTRSGASVGGGSSTGCASALAISTFAAYPGASATSFSPAGHGAMYSCAPKPPIIPTSDSTRYHSSPTRSNTRS